MGFKFSQVHVTHVSQAGRPESESAWQLRRVQGPTGSFYSPGMYAGGFCGVRNTDPDPVTSHGQDKADNG